MSASALWLVRVALALWLPFAVIGASAQDHHEATMRTLGAVPQPVIEKALVGTQCVADPAFMRRNHMDLLRHQRDDTVRGGVRKASYSLKDCIACHASQSTHSVTASASNFCQSCHAYAAVHIDCFECHANQPQAKP